MIAVIIISSIFIIPLAVIFELAKSYQIVYFTCKTERSLRK